ncbi:MAG: ABC transporter ATP-binding protein [Actinomycetota bacterium]|nr:ABC transporter ATP-binding protein [Actinomycetota bacterium]
MTELAIRVQGLRKVFGSTVAVRGVDLDVPVGAVMGVLGPNGSGKTTLIRLLLALSRPTAGTVELLGAPMPAAAGRVLPHVGALVEGPAFHPFLSGRENLRRCAVAEPLLATEAIPESVERALDRVGLADAAERRYRAYSLGMKQRLGLAAVLLTRRRLVVLDEPTNGLDPAGTREVRRIIAELHDHGATVLVSSHLLAEVEATCTHVAVLDRGNLIAAGSLAALLDGEAPTLDVRTPDAAIAVDALRVAGLSAAATSDGVRVELADTEAPTVISVLVGAGVAVHEVQRRRTALDELFAQLTEGDGQ